MFYFIVISFFSLFTSFNLASIILSERVPIPLDYNDNSTSLDDDRIVGGSEADIRKYPYQVSFVVNNSWFCGGSIISENYIMTAAHCVEGAVANTIVLRAGSSWRKNGTVIPISYVAAHPEYNKPAFDKDVGVMKTAEPLKFNDKIQPINLPEEGEPINCDSIAVSGWGRTQQGANSIPDRLMEADIPVVPWYRCKLVYYTILTKNMWCGGNFWYGGQGTCQGDSGGAATCDGKVHGIVSFGRGCAQPLSPSAFADVSSPAIRNFIKKETGL